MSSITAADLKLGGRLVAACDAIAAGHLHKAASIFSEITEELNAEATVTAMSAEEGAENSTAQVISPPSTPAHTGDLQSCARGAHFFGAPDPVTGWRTCGVCGSVNVTPPGDGPIDVGASNASMGDL